MSSHFVIPLCFYYCLICFLELNFILFKKFAVYNLQQVL